MSSDLYNKTSEIGKLNLELSTVFCIIMGIILFIIGYYNNKDWNYNLIDIPSIIVSIDNPSGICDAYTISSNNKTNTYYNCTFTCKYTINDIDSTVQFSTSSTTKPYNPGDLVMLTYDSTSTKQPVLQISRFYTKWFIIGGFLFLLGGIVDYMILRSSYKPILATYGALNIGSKLL
jgi:hypothetical protein